MRRSAFLIIALALPGCGGSGERPAAEKATVTPAATADRSSGLDQDQVQIRRAVARYYDALAAKDFPAVCATLVPSEQSYFTGLAGKCPRAFAQEARRLPPRRLKLLAELEADRVRIKGDRATITVTNAYFSGRHGRLYALRENGAWGLARRKARPD